MINLVRRVFVNVLFLNLTFWNKIYFSFSFRL